MTELQMPRIGVMPSRSWPAAKNLTTNVRPLLIKDWSEVWTVPWDTDAHFVCYYLTNTGQSRWPRCRKTVLPRLRELEPACDIVTQLLVLDYDNPGHLRWTEETLAKWLEKLAGAADTFELAWRWNILYTTTHGARLVYVLDHAIPVDEAEGMHRWLVQQLREVGITIDDITAVGNMTNGEPAKTLFPTSDWTRLFRLPFVMRDNRPTWEEEVAEFLEQPEQILCVEELGTLGSAKRGRKAELLERDDPKPDPDYAAGLLYQLNPDSGRMIQSPWHKEAKRRLKGRLCFPCLFKHEPIAGVGQRDSTIMRYMGEASTLLFRIADESGERLTTPEHMYGLFLDPIQQLDPDDDTPDWTDVLWRHVLYCWAREEAEHEQRRLDEEQRDQDAIGLLEGIVYGMREWCDHPDLHGADAEAREFAVTHLIAACDKSNYIMTKSGYYDAMPVLGHLLIPRIRALGMGTLIQFQVPSAKGEGYRTVPASELIADYATAVSQIRGVPGKPDGRGAWVDHIDEQFSAISVPLFRRRDLEPRFDRHVDIWLQKLFGPHFEEACNWIGWALAVEEGPICALSLRGKAGAGKKMLVQGLAECFSGECAAGAEELVNTFQPGLMVTPILCVDEGWPSRSGGKHPADMFRELVGGGKRRIDMKYKAPVEIRNPVRILFTANNFDVVRMLCGSRDMSPEDRDALAIRLLHYDIGDKASIHLREMGGADSHTNGWIAGDGGSNSNYVAAKHFMWLYYNARRPRDPRLLVEGNGHTALMTEMRTSAGSAPFVIETVLKMLEFRQREFPGLTIEKGELYVTTAEVLDYFRSTLAKTCSERLTANRIGEVFAGLVKRQTEPRQLKTRKGQGRKRWHQLDLVVLQKVARNDGWKCERLDGLIEEQRRRGILEPEVT